MAAAMKSVPFRNYIQAHERDLPLLVHVTDSADEQILAGDVLRLMSVTTFVHAEHWSQPTVAQICTGSGKREVHLKLEREINVTARDIDCTECEGYVMVGPAANYRHEPYAYDQVEKLAHVQEGSYVVVCHGKTGKNEKRITDGAHIVVLGHEKKQGVILKGKTSYLLAPKDYDKETKFRMQGKEYPTPYDLWKSDFEGEVTATKYVKCPQGYQSRIESIHQMDRIQLVKGRKQTELPKIVSCDKGERCEVVRVRRNFSQFSDRLGVIFLDPNARACFEESPPIIGQHSMVDLLKHDHLPMDIELAELPQMHSVSEDGRILLCESPFKVVQQCNYSVTYISSIDTHTMTPVGEVLEVLDCYDITVLSSKSTPIVNTARREGKPQSRLFTLSSAEYCRLVGDPEYFEFLEEDVLMEQVSPTFIKLEMEHPPLQLSLSMPTDPPPPPPNQTLPPIDSTGNRPLPQPPHLTNQTFHHPAPEVNQPPQFQPPAENQISQSILDPGSRAASSSSETVNHLSPIQPRKIQGNKYAKKSQSPIPTRRTIASGSPTTESKKPVPRPRSRSNSRERLLTASATPPLKPPEDGDISGFSEQQLAGLLKYLQINEHAVETCLAKQIDGRKLCDMNQEVMCETLCIEENKSFGLQYFVSKSKK